MSLKYIHSGFWTTILVLFLLLCNAWSSRPSCPGCNSPSTCGTLHDVVTYLMCKSIVVAYPPPSLEFLDDWNGVVLKMLKGVHCSSSQLPNSLQRLHYELHPWRVTVNTTQYYCLLASFQLDPSGHYLAHPYGTVIVNYQDPQVKPLAIEIPHSIHDAQTYRQGITIFEGTHAKIFSLSLAHRKSAVEPSCNGEKYSLADAAHNAAHTFQATAVAIQQYFYEEEIHDFTAIQFHGMTSQRCPNDDIFLSHGSSLVPKRGEKLELLRDALRSQTAGTMIDPQRISMVGDSSCKLYGTKNAQGRLYNGVSQDRVCDTAATGYTGNFVQAEQTSHIRAQASFDHMWIQALNAVDFSKATAPTLSLQLRFPTTANGNVVYIGEQVKIIWNALTLHKENNIQILVHRAYSKELMATVDADVPNTGRYTWLVDRLAPMDEDLILGLQSTTMDRIVLAFSNPFRVVSDISFLTDL